MIQETKDSIKAVFPYVIVSAIAVVAVRDQSVTMAYASILGVGFILTNNLIEKIKLKENKGPQISEELRRQLQDLTARTTTLEFGVKQRGF